MTLGLPLVLDLLGVHDLLEPAIRDFDLLFILVLTIQQVGAFANQKIKNFRSQIEVFNRDITSIDAGLKDSSLGLTDKLVLQTRLTTDQQQKLTITQLLQQASIVEKPAVLTGAHASRVTARSRRNAVVVAALIGLVLGAIVALMWDGVAAGWNRRRNHLHH